MPKVSVIMATYNCEKTIKESIDSILTQTFSDWEFIICDDCSTDNTYDILIDYEKNYPEKFIILRNQENSKLAFSLNRCLEVSKGEYIARMDGDDKSAPERFEKQVEFLDAHPEFSVVGTAMVPFDENGTRATRFLAIEEPEGKDLVSGPVFCHATIMMRKKAYDIVNGYTVCKRTQRAQDYDMWFRFFAAGLKGYNLNEPLYYVLEDENAIKRRTFKSRCYESQTRIKGYRLLHYPLHLYVYAIKPIISALVPVSLIQKYHKKADEKSAVNK